MNNSKIEWTHHTANLWHGCQEVHAGCDHCYARVMDNRFSGGHWGPHTPRLIVRSVWSDLAKMQRDAEAAGEMRRVFVGSMMDIAEKPMPLVDRAGNEIMGQDTGFLRDLLFQQISAGMYPNLLFLFLTKRPGNLPKYLPPSWLSNPPANVMYGTSVVNQKTADMLIPQLLQVPGKRFLSCEPLIGSIDLSKWIGPIHIDTLASECGFFDGKSEVNNGYGCNHPDQEERENGSGKCFDFSCPIASRLHPSEPLDAPIYKAFGFNGDEYDFLMPHDKGIHWVIAGGESGHGARPCHPDWLRSLRDQCAAADVPFFFKQHGEWLPFYDRDKDDPDWRRIPKESSSVEYINLAGGTGFHGERVVCFKRVGKKAAGRLLDGAEYNEFPKY